MKTEDLTKASGGASNKGKYLYAAIIGIALIVLTEGFTQNYEHHLVSLPNPIPQTSTSSLTDSTNPTTAKPVFHKKELVFKRTLAKSEYSSIRTSALSDGYKALSVIPPSVVASQASFRMPQFPNSSALGNYQALSALGTQQYYSNLNVQQFLNNLSTQQYLNDMKTWENNLTTQQHSNNLSTQQYLNDMKTWENNLTTQQYWNNLSTQQYLNNFNNLNTFSNPTYSQPMPQINIQPMPQINIQPMPQINIQPMPQIHFQPMPQIHFQPMPQINIPSPSFHIP